VPVLETTFQKIISFALNNEKEAAEFYTDMSTRAKKQNAKTMFSELAAEEMKHREFFEGLAEDRLPDLPVEKVVDLKISEYLVDVEFKQDMDYQDILILAMKKEESAVKLYNDMATKVQAPKLRKLLEAMAQEEAKHKLRLETEYDENVLAED